MSWQEWLQRESFDVQEVVDGFGALREEDRPKGSALFRALEARRAESACARPLAGKQVRVVVVGAGLSGLLCAIELKLSLGDGVHVLVLEKRARLSRLNVLHLWRPVIAHLSSLGVKHLMDSFCLGNIAHVPIRELQLALLKLALLVGAQVRLARLDGASISAEDGWQLRTEPSGVVAPGVAFLVAGDGENSVVARTCAFSRKIKSSPMAIGVTANFENDHSPENLRVREINVSSHFRRAFFTRLREEHALSLENLVHYNSTTHYLVMTVRYACLLQRGVLRQEHSTVPELLARENVDRDALEQLARDVGEHAVQIPEGSRLLDCAIFDFSQKKRARSPVKAWRVGHSTIAWCYLVGDALIEPFWPLGTGANRAVLSALDAAHSIVTASLDARSKTRVLAAISDALNVHARLKYVTPNSLKEPPSTGWPLLPASRYAKPQAKTYRELSLMHYESSKTAVDVDPAFVSPWKPAIKEQVKKHRVQARPARRASKTSSAAPATPGPDVSRISKSDLMRQVAEKVHALGFEWDSDLELLIMQKGYDTKAVLEKLKAPYLANLAELVDSGYEEKQALQALVATENELDPAYDMLDQ